jgi:hypothetical protein
MPRHPPYFMPDVEPTIAVIQSARFARSEVETSAARRKQLPWVSVGAAVCLFMAGWIAGLVNKHHARADLTESVRIVPD